MKFIFLTLLLFSQVTHAESWTSEDFKQELISPYTTDARSVLWIGSGITLALVIFDDPIIDPFQQKQVRNKTLGESSRWGDWMGQLVPNIIYIGAMSYKGYKGDTESNRRAIGMFKATSYAVGVTSVLKYTIREPRPIDSSWKNSFPSGHTTSAFAFSGYVMAEHEYWIGVPALLLSTFIGYSRINDNMHWLHDVTAGATIGWVYGWGISRLQAKNAKSSSESTYVMPIYDSKTIGLVAFREF